MRRAGVGALLVVAAASGGPAAAQRAEENVVTAAADAFGASLGRESIGLYSEGSVRGFSPERAGNIRVEGLYYDRRAFMTGRLRTGSTIHVGLTAIDYPFPAPTGIADIQLQRAGDRLAGSVTGGSQPFGGALLEGEAQLPVARGLGVTVAAGGYIDGYEQGGHGVFLSHAVVARWRPAPGVEVTPFWGQADGLSVDYGPLYAGRGGAPPDRIERGRYFAPKWAAASFVNGNFGVLTKADLGGGWRVDAGAIRSIEHVRRGGTTLFLDAAGGTADGLVISDRNLSNASWSGEARLTRAFTTGDLAHRVALAARGRSVALAYGGSAVTRLGRVPLGVEDATPAPALAFGAPTRARVQQGTLGLAWTGTWPGRAQLSVGLQRTDYHVTAREPGLPPALRRDRPWLWNAALAVEAAPGITLYAGATRGLEENGVAPNDAANRNEALPALLTRQLDAGARAKLGGLTLIGGLFDIRKPYFARDAANRFTQAGTVRHRGIEASLSGPLAPGLTLVAGALWLDAGVSGEAVDAGALGRRPVGRARTEGQLTLDWRPRGTSPLSLDVGLFHGGPVTATQDGRVRTPPDNTVDVGARWRMRWGGRPVTLRAQMHNVLNHYRWEVASDGLYTPSAPRTAFATLTADL